MHLYDNWRTYHAIQYYNIWAYNISLNNTLHALDSTKNTTIRFEVHILTDNAARSVQRLAIQRLDDQDIASQLMFSFPRRKAPYSKRTISVNVYLVKVYLPIWWWHRTRWHRSVARTTEIRSTPSWPAPGVQASSRAASVRVAGWARCRVSVPADSAAAAAQLQLNIKDAFHQIYIAGPEVVARVGYAKFVFGCTVLSPQHYHRYAAAHKPSMHTTR